MSGRVARQCGARVLARIAEVQSLPDTKIGRFTQALYDEVKSKGWSVISMKKDWKRILAFE